MDKSELSREGPLTKTDREYLTGESEVSGNLEYKRRKHIRDRMKNCLKDFYLLELALKDGNIEPGDVGDIFSGIGELSSEWMSGEGPLEEAELDDTKEGEEFLGFHAIVRIFYLSVGYGHQAAANMLLEDAIRKAVFEIVEASPGEISRPDVEVDVSVSGFWWVNADEALEKFRNSQADYPIEKANEILGELVSTGELSLSEASELLEKNYPERELGGS